MDTKAIREALERYDRAVSAYWKDTENAPNNREMTWIRQLLDENERLRERLQDYLSEAEVE